MVIPAGVGQKCLSDSDDFTVVGAYPDGMEPNMNRVKKPGHSKADQNVDDVPRPQTDPLLGQQGGLCDIWK